MSKDEASLSSTIARQLPVRLWYNRLRLWEKSLPSTAGSRTDPTVAAATPSRDPKGSVMDPTFVRNGQPKREGAPSSGGRYTFASGARPLAGYTIKRAIGRGGFSEVYYAVTDAGKDVALKHILRNVDVERRGVIQCMNLKSPHLVTIHDLRTNDEGDTFVIMEYLAGPSLATLLEQHPNGLPLREVRIWVEGLVAGVSYLHDHGIVHRDLKPANLFMEEGVVKIGDYGLSKAMAGTQVPGHSQSVGTCHYMAPEIGSGKYNKPIDIYAMGVIIYELLTGRVPFAGESVQEVLMKHLTARPDLTSLPDPYRSLVGKAMAKDPALRPARAVDLLPAVETPAPPKAAQRFFGGAKRPPAVPEAPAASRPEPEFVIPAAREEPVFYIGPDTVPPGTPRQNGDKIRGLFGWNRRPQAAQRRGQPVAPARAAAVEIPKEPLLPASRLRLAELSTSMLIAAVLAALATLLVGPLMEGPVFGYPNNQDLFPFAQLFGMTLLASWAIMVPAKLWEGRSVSSLSKRITYLCVGAALGALTGALVQYLGGGPSEGWISGLQNQAVVNLSPGFRSSLPQQAAGFFGLALAVPRVWKLVDRGRRFRFRAVPVVANGFIAAVASGLAFQEPAAAIPLTLATIVVQFASPWSRDAARYARYAATTQKRSRKLA